MRPLWDLLEETLGKGFEKNTKLLRNVQKLSDIFTEKREATIIPAYFSNRALADAYLGYFLPLGFHKVLLLLQANPTVFQAAAPQHWVDFGAGPGTASLAALAAYHLFHKGNPNPPPVCIDLIDSQLEVFDIAQPLIGKFAAKLGITVKVRFFKDFEIAKTDPLDANGYTLSLAVNVLNELPTKDTPGVREPLLSIWDATAGAMLVVEPSHRVPSQRLVRFRERLLAEDKKEKNLSRTVHMMGPCTHQEACPLNRTQHWCHFSEPVADQNLIQMSLNTFKNPRLWLKFSYLCYQRGTRVVWEKTYRAIGDLHPSGGPQKLAIDLCKPAEKHVLRISSRSPIFVKKPLVRGALVELNGETIKAKPLSAAPRAKSRH